MIDLASSFGQMLRQVPVLGDSASVALALHDVDFRVEAEAVLVEDGEELTRRRRGCGHRLEGRGVQRDVEFSTLVGGSVPYGHKGVVVDQWRLSRRKCEDGGDGADDAEGDAGQEGWGHHNGSGQREERQQIRLSPNSSSVRLYDVFITTCMEAGARHQLALIL